MRRHACLAFLGCLFGGVVLAQTATSLDGVFRQLDKNGDGKLTIDEVKFSPRLEKTFLEIDKDKKGFLLPADLRRHYGVPEPKANENRPEPPPLEAPRRGPVRLLGADHGIGKLIRDVPFTDRAGKDHRIVEALRHPATVIAFGNPTCPIGKKYIPTLARIRKSCEERNVLFLEVDPAQAKELAAILGGTSTTETFVLDGARTLVYRGAIDDQYGLGYAHDEARKHYLLDAIEATLAAKPVAIAATTAPGCEVELEAPKGITKVTYHGHISRLVQQHCLTCHREGGVAPFSLSSPEEVMKHAATIKRVVEKGNMPPWFAAPKKENEESRWANDRSMPARDKADLLTWLASDRPLGNVADAPVPVRYPEGWTIGTPDAVFQIPQPIAIKAEGTMPYQNVSVPTNFDEDKWVQALEIQPTSREVVHHVLVFAKSRTGQLRSGQFAGEADEESRGFFAAYVPGNSSRIYLDGFAKRLPKGATLRFQIHYTPNGTATKDQVKLGLVFAKKPPRYEVHVTGIVNASFNIPAGADNHPVNAKLNVPFDANLMGFMPHMHVRGKAYRYELTDAVGKKTTLLDVPHYDFNWQLHYVLAEPQRITKGSTINATGWFDNSSSNPANPDPTRAVRWGPQTSDEMMLGYVEYFVTARE